MCGPQDLGSRHSGPWAQSMAAGALRGPQGAGKDTAAGLTLPAACPFPTRPGACAHRTELGDHTGRPSLAEGG